MQIAVTATDPSLEARVEPRFGRCPYFLIVDTDTLQFEAVQNRNAALGGGAGIQSAQLMADRAVRSVLTGNCGPNAFQVLSAAGIDVVTGCSGVIMNVIEQFKAGRLSAAGDASVGAKAGLAGAPSPVAGTHQEPAGGGAGGGGGMGRGGGRGRGRGGGRGAGGGRGRGMGMAAGAPQQPAGGQDAGEELAMLKAQAESLNQQMRQIQERIQQLEQRE